MRIAIALLTLTSFGTMLASAAVPGKVHTSTQATKSSKKKAHHSHSKKGTDTAPASAPAK